MTIGELPGRVSSWQTSFFIDEDQLRGYTTSDVFKVHASTPSMHSHYKEHLASCTVESYKTQDGNRNEMALIVHYSYCCRLAGSIDAAGLCLPSDLTIRVNN